MTVAAAMSFVLLIGPHGFALASDPGPQDASASVPGTAPDQAASSAAAESPSAQAAPSGGQAAAPAEAPATKQPSTDAASSPITTQLSTSGSPAPPDALVTYRNELAKTVEPRVDEASGALQYEYPISVPPGRNGLQPELKLEYDSQRNDQDGLLGYGWASDIPTIGRINRYGVEKLYTDPVFTSDLDGELVETASGTYAAKVEQGSFNAYAYSSAGNSWTVTDKLGKVFKFGTTAGSRMDNATTTQAYRWYLDEVRDTNDNYVKYEYTKSQGQVYPYRITYTGHGTTDGPFTVTFVLGSRPDVTKSFEAGFGVTTASRISEIDVAISGVLARKYALGYAMGANGSRSLLASITETGYGDSGTPTTLPATQFGYGSAADSPGWTSTADPGFGVTFNGFDWGHVLVDVNGDGLVDDVRGLGIGGGAVSDVYLNSGQGTWTLSPGWRIPLPTALYGCDCAPPLDAGTRFVDLNGDGLVDVLHSTLFENQSGTNDYVQIAYLNTGSGWVQSAAWTPTIPFVITDPNGDLHDNGVRFVDLDGDGLVDMSVSGYAQGDAGNYYNTGSGWAKNGTPPFKYNDTRYDLGTRTIDVNGDGLVDMVTGCASSGYAGTSAVYLNDGTDHWVRDTVWDLPLPTCTNNQQIGMSQDGGTRFMDVNNDGLVDVVQYALDDNQGPTPNVYTAYKDVYINTGHGWTEASSWAPPGPFIFRAYSASTSHYFDPGTRIADFDGDGEEDILRDNLPSYYPYTDLGIYHSRSAPELLTSATTAQGGVYRWSYQATPTYRNGSGLLNPGLPSALQTIATSVKDNGFGAVETTTYSYQGGKYRYASAFDRKFAGFAKTVATDASGASVTTYYHQGDASATDTGEYLDSFHKIGKSYREETRDAAGHLFGVTIDKWDQQDLGNGRAFVQLARETRKDYDGNGSHRDTAIEYAYDNHGNLTSATDSGEVVANDDGSFTDTGSDKTVTTDSYATSGPSGLQTRELVTDQSGATARDTKRYYDTLAFGSATKGNLTKTERWVSGSTYLNSQKAYDGTYGLVTSDTDPRGKVTTYAYDSYELYPATVTNPLSQQTQYQYDYSSGKPKQTTDPNLLVTQTVFDGLDRPLSERQPDPSDPATLVDRTTYAYGDAALAAYVKRTDWLDGSTGVDAWTYLDGFGRPIQTRKRAEAADTYATADTAYDDRAQVLKTSLPYFSTGTSRTSPTSDATLYTTYAYDPLKRPASETNAVGTTSYAYDDWKTTVTDPRGSVKNLLHDAYGRLNRVEEVLNATNTFATAYDYDGNDNLTGITDALGNVRAFTYDGLGRRLTAQDLHAPSDASFGTWTYTYDDAGNLTSAVDPKGQTVDTAFDDVNRPVSEDFTGQSGLEAVFGYDACPYGIGHLCSESDASASTTRQYGPIGQAVSETKTVAGTGYTTATAYDRQGNVVTMTLPDGSQVQNLYGAGGQLEKVRRKESGDASWSDVVSNFDRSPVGKPTTVAYANGETTTDAYDAAHLYRLTGKVTAVNGGNLQDLSYLYDADGNVTGISEAAGPSARTVAYEYDGLNRLMSAAADDAPSGYVPDTTIFSGPADVSWSAGASIAFGSADPGVTSYQCKLDAGAWSTCVSPQTYSGLALGAHSFQVRAVNPIGTDPTPAVLSWTAASVPLPGSSIAVSATAGCDQSGGCTSGSTMTLPLTAPSGPNTYLIADVSLMTIYSGCSDTPTAKYNGVAMSSTQYVSFGGASWSQFEVTNPAAGAHNLVVTRPSGCQTTVIASAFSGVDQSNPHGTEATATGSGSSIAATATAAQGGLIYSALSDQNNPEVAPVTAGLGIVADQRMAYRPAAGATLSASGTTVTAWTLTPGCCSTWTLIDTPLKPLSIPPPDTGIVSGPRGSSWSTSAALTFISPVQGATFQCSLDGGAWSACASPQTYAGLSQGGHAFQVRAVSSGGTDPTPASLSWTVTAAPLLSQGSGQPSSRSERYAYDPLGGLLSKTVSVDGSATSTSVYAYSGAGNANPHAATSVGSASYAYDDDGNLSTRGSDSFAWDYRNRLLSAAVNGATSTYAYDPEGMRVRMASGSASTSYASDWYSVSGGKATKHLFADGVLIATVEGSTSTAVVHYVATDHLTGASVVTSATGSVEESVDYNPYGDIRLDNAAGYSEVRKYAGLEYDAASGLNYAGSRYYDSSTGRFLSEDPLFLAVGDGKQLGDILDKMRKQNDGLEGNGGKNDQTKQLENVLSDPQKLNSYSYVQNNPLKYIDPTGNAGVGVNIGYTAETGDLLAGAAGTRSASLGVFWGGSTGLNQGRFTSQGIFAAVPDASTSNPATPGEHDKVLGAYAGAGASIFITNAQNAADFAGTSKNYSGNAAFGPIEGGVQFSIGKNSDGKAIWSLSFSAPPIPGLGIGLSASRYSSNTTIISGPSLQHAYECVP